MSKCMTDIVVDEEVENGECINEECNNEDDVEILDVSELRESYSRQWRGEVDVELDIELVNEGDDSDTFAKEVKDN